MQSIARAISRNQPCRAAFLALLALLGANGTALAGKWTVTKDISAIESYTDNASLIAPPTGGEFVTQVTPGIHVHGEGARFTGNLDYTPSFVFYSRNASQNQVINSLNANGTLEAINNFFYVDAFGNITQTFVSPFAPQPTNLTNFTSNRIQGRSYGISPYVRGFVGNAFDYELRYRSTWRTTNDAALPSERTTEWIGHAASPIRLFGWALDYNASTIGYSTYSSQNLNSRLGRATLYYQPSLTLRLSVDGGREENNYSSFQTRSNSIYGGGLSWRPNPRTSADLDFEHRYFGAYRLVSLRHRTRLTDWLLTYSRNASNYPQLANSPLISVSSLLDTILSTQIPDPAQRQLAVQQFLLANGIPADLPISLSFFTQQIVVQQQLEARFGILGRLSSVFFTAIRTKTSPITSNFTPGVPDAFLSSQSPITQRGFGVNASRKLTVNTSISASAYQFYAQQDTPSGLESRSNTYTLTLTHTLSPRTTTFGGLYYTHFTTLGSGGSSSDSRSIMVGLHHTF